MLAQTAQGWSVSESCRPAGQAGSLAAQVAECDVALVAILTLPSEKRVSKWVPFIPHPSPSLALVLFPSLLARSLPAMERGARERATE